MKFYKTVDVDVDLDVDIFDLLSETTDENISIIFDAIMQDIKYLETHIVIKRGIAAESDLLNIAMKMNADDIDTLKRIIKLCEV